MWKKWPSLTFPKESWSSIISKGKEGGKRKELRCGGKVWHWIKGEGYPASKPSSLGATEFDCGIGGGGKKEWGGGGGEVEALFPSGR